MGGEPVNLILVRYGEIALKGGNRHLFVSRLRRNIRACLSANGLSGDVRSEGQRILVRTDHVQEALEALSRVFGIVSLSPVVEVPNDLEAISGEALCQARQRDVGENTSYCVRARRSWKRFPLTSPAINKAVGTAIKRELRAPVDLGAPDVTVAIEVRREGTLISTDTVAGEGGLPVGSEGKVVALMSGGIDSPVAAWMMMKRGCGVIPLHLAQSEADRRKTLENVENLRRYSYGFELRPAVVDHAAIMAPIIEALRQIGEERWTCLFCKRAMLIRATALAEELGAHAVVMGDSLGQVASQTLANMEAISFGIAKPILRPLIGMDKTEIVALAERIGTFQTSIQGSDACPFLPKAPVTRATVVRLKSIIARLEPLTAAGLSL